MLQLGTNNVGVTHGGKKVVQFILGQHGLDQFPGESPFSLVSGGTLETDFLIDQLVDPFGRNDSVVILRGNLMMSPLPNLSTTNFGSGRIFHGIVEGDTSDATQPCLGVRQYNVNPSGESFAGDCLVGRKRTRVWQFQQVAFRDGGSDHSGLTDDLVGSFHVLIKYLSGYLYECRMGYPSSVVSRQDLTQLVLFDLLHGGGIPFGIVFDGDRRRHASHGKGTTFVANVNQPFHVRFHERRRHGQMRTIGGDQIAVVTEFLDKGEQIIPSSTIETNRMVLQFVQDFFHFKGSRDGLE
mmetsp:Transcript_29833/g.49498  ORF Transcript_29833/g.49498 Transcript_29833/m.49498 type:complete len:296 (-) Transcript_29833:289-1176(-)